MLGQGARIGSLGLLALVAGCHITVRATEEGRVAPAEQPPVQQIVQSPAQQPAQQSEERDERTAVLIALGAQMQREKHPGMIVVHGNFLEPEDRPQGPPPTRFQPMRPVDPAIMSYALAAGASVDISPRPSGRWYRAFYEGAGRKQSNPVGAQPPIRIYHHSLDVPVVIGDSAYVDISETILIPGTGMPAESMSEGWRYALRRQSPDYPWIMTGRVLIWAY